MLMHQFSLSSSGAQRRCNLQFFILKVCNLYFLILDYWLLRGLAHASTTGSKSPLYFLARLLTPDYNGVGGSLT